MESNTLKRVREAIEATFSMPDAASIASLTRFNT